MLKGPESPLSAISSAILDNGNPYRGGVIGGVIDAIVRTILADVSYRTSREAALNDEVVERRTEDGRLIKDKIR